MENRTPLIAGNWKMYKTVPEAVEAASRIAGLVGNVMKPEVMIAPPFTALAPVSKAIEGSPVCLGAQDLFWEREGAYTGKISGPMLRSAGCRYVIIGHSEQRQLFGETDETVNRKIRAAFDSDLIPVFCLGETEMQRDAGETFSVLDKQVQNGLDGFSPKQLATMVVAYEPVWAIGTGKSASREQAQEAHAHIRGRLKKSFGDDLARSVRVLYGGSVKPDNIAGLMAMPDVDGALVGGASLDPETFSRIVHYE
jgi:triosephosphate isomerase